MVLHNQRSLIFVPHMCVCVCVCIYIYIYIYIYTQKIKAMFSLNNGPDLHKAHKFDSVIFILCTCRAELQCTGDNND